MDGYQYLSAKFYDGAVPSRLAAVGPLLLANCPTF